MSLWTPYVADADLPLDLTKTIVKEESVSPAPVIVSAPVDYAPYNPYAEHLEPLYAEYTDSIQQPVYYASYPYPPAPAPPMYDASASSTQMSPVSASSTCSGGYDATTAAHTYQRLQPAALSPPVTPDANLRQSSRSANYMVEADALSDDPDFQAFQRDALRAMAEKNGGTLLGNNPRMRRAVKSTNQDAADDLYRKQRERNNFAAKQSRDRRKLRELQLALKVTYLKNVVANLQGRLALKSCARCQRLCDC